LNPLDPAALALRRATAKKLYGAIVAQARLPVFYRSFGLPDTAGRPLHAAVAASVFAMLHRLKHEGAEGRALAQELIDLFTQKRC
jgi:cytochrome b pre-mRNA-processing protein 3